MSAGLTLAQMEHRIHDVRPWMALTVCNNSMGPAHPLGIEGQDNTTVLVLVLRRHGGRRAEKGRGAYAKEGCKRVSRIEGKEKKIRAMPSRMQNWNARCEEGPQLNWSDSCEPKREEGGDAEGGEEELEVEGRGGLYSSDLA